MQKHEAFIEAVKAAPPASVAGLTLYGVALNDVVLVLTGMYTVFLIIDKIPTMFKRVAQLSAWIKGKTHDRTS